MVRRMPAAPDDSFATAVLESRARWRDLALLGADLLFETDADGRIAFLAPDRVLGQQSAALLGLPAATLLADGRAPNPFAASSPPRGLRSWLAGAGGSPACFEFTAVETASGGLRGIARDVTDQERQAEATARALRRATSLVRLFGLAQRSRSEGGAAAPALERLMTGLQEALGCGGVALAENNAGAWRLLHIAGEAGALATADPAGALLVPAAPGLSLAAWRNPPPDDEERDLLAALAPALAGLHAEAARQRDLARAARTDPLTGLLNRRGFADAVADSRARSPHGVLAYLDMDGLKRLNDRHGHAAGDAAIVAFAARVALGLGAEEVAARLGGDEFAIWLPGATREAAQARVAALGTPGPLAGFPLAGPEAVAASIGLAAVGVGDALEPLLERADAAMYERKRERRAA
jgi:diguanylate cyclase (GGDEF)-like protein